jgi:putative flippase GtrA
MLASTRLAINYAIFALIATVANIGAQDLVIRTYTGAFSILASVIVGTGVGLIVKYILDKHYIFRFHAHSIAHDTRTFALYTLMGLATTVVFWGFEFGFHHIFETKEMRYLGGIIGLAIGYLTKYHLDKRYVFRSEVV